MQLPEYLARIGYSGEVTPTVAALRNLHRRHMFSVPFENLDIPLHREIVLDLEHIYDKIVRHHRGGFCYEQNAIFAWALRVIGFQADMLSAGVARPDGSYSPDFDHMCLLVRVPESGKSGREPEEGDASWLADVGFGDSFVEPIPFLLDHIHRERGWEYQITRDGDGYLLRRRSTVSNSEANRAKADWKHQYRFTLPPRQLSDYSQMCNYHQTSPLSHFTQNRICSRATPDGRVTLSGTAGGTTLIVTENGTRTDTPVESPADFERLLKQHFGIQLTGFSAGVHADNDP